MLLLSLMHHQAFGWKDVEFQQVYDYSSYWPTCQIQDRAFEWYVGHHHLILLRAHIKILWLVITLASSSYTCIYIYIYTHTRVTVVDRNLWNCPPKTKSRGSRGSKCVPCLKLTSHLRTTICGWTEEKKKRRTDRTEFMKLFWSAEFHSHPVWATRRELYGLMISHARCPNRHQWARIAPSFQTEGSDTVSVARKLGRNTQCSCALSWRSVW